MSHGPLVDDVIDLTSDPGAVTGRVVDVRITRESERSPTRSVAVVGLGYVGLPTALAFASAGASVVGIDASPARLDAVAARRVDLVPADHERLGRLLGRPEFRLSAEAAAVAAADTVVICVPTPVDDHLGPDLRFVQAACDEVVTHARAGQTVILTSTTYVGCTNDLLAEPLRERGLVPGRDVSVAFSPERIDPANVTFPQDRVPRVVGGVTPSCTRVAADALRLVTPLVHSVSSPEAAEATKLLENTFRAVNIALANEFADVSAALGLDVREVIDAAGTKPYGFMPFYPGPGVGGHCIPCDPHYLLWQLRAARVHAPLITEAMTAISLRPERVVARVGEVLSDAGQGLSGARVVVVGVAYKPGVEDVRESPAIPIIEGLLQRGADVAYLDSLVPTLRLRDGRELTSLGHPADVEADVVIVHTLHPGADSGWLVAHPLVVDATFRLDGVPQRVTP